MLYEFTHNQAYLDMATRAATRATKIANILDEYDIDLVVAGPGFNAGRYGMACGGVCKIAFDKGIPAVSALYEENPGLELYRKYGYIFPAEGA